MTAPSVQRSAAGRRAIVATAAVALVAALFPAFSAAQHTESFSFDGAGTDAGAFTNLGRVAIDQGDGVLYAIDDRPTGGVVDRFAADGSAADFSALGSSSLDGSDVGAPDGPVAFDLAGDSDLAVDNSESSSEGRVYVLSAPTSTVFAFAASGEYLLKLALPGGSQPCGIAVGPDGDVWVSDRASESVLEFNASGSATGTSVDTSAEGEPCRVSIDGDSNLFVQMAIDSEGGLAPAFMYEGDGTLVGKIATGVVRALAVDPTDGNVFVLHDETVEEIDPEGIDPGRQFGFDPLIGADAQDFGKGSLSGAIGVAVLAENANAYVSAMGDEKIHIFAPPPPAAPEASALPTASITTTSAVLGGNVTANGNPTRWFVELSTDSGFAPAETRSLPAGEDGEGGSGFVETPVSIAAEGLGPATTYYARVVAENTLGSDASDPETFTTSTPPPVDSECPNARFRVGASAALPQCRAFERLTPEDKNNGSPRGSALVIDPDHVLLALGASIFPDDTHFNGGSAHLATRGADSWSLRNEEPGANSSILDIGPDPGTRIVAGPDVLAPEDEDVIFGALSAVDVYRRTSQGFDLVSKGSLHPNALVAATYAGQSADGTRILFQTNERLEPKDDATGAETPELYERSEGVTRIVGLDDSGNLLPGGAVLGNGADSTRGGSANAISADGSKVFFESPAPGLGSPTLFARIGRGDTVAVSASQCERVAPPCQSGGLGARFEGASEDGTRVFFTTASQLVDSDLDLAEDLYRYDFNSGDLTLLSGGIDEEDAAVVGYSEDGRRVYFVAGDSVYFDDDQATEPTLVAELPGDTNGLSMHGLQAPSRFASVTPDGRFLLFQSKARLTAFVNEGASEIYRFDASSGRILCISCNPFGAPPRVPATFSLPEAASIESALVPGFIRFSAAAGTKHDTVISDDGSTIAFESNDKLLPADASPGTDIYLWHEGNLSLLTDGVAPFPPRLLGISRNGETIVFNSIERLVPADGDEISDVYAARVDGGIEADYPAPPPVPCAGDDCQGPSTPTPQPQSPGTESFVGTGDPTPSHCPKGKVRRNGRCVSGKAKKHKSKPHHKKRAGTGRRASR